jgi:predicted urease superfamily metal-dependent hydrolase
MFEPGLEARNIFLDLLKKGEIFRQFRQSWIGHDARLIDGGRAGRDQRRVERVVLGPSQMHPAKSFNLNRLQHEDDKARRPEMLHHPAFIAAGRFDADARNAGLGQVGRQHLPTRRGIGDPANVWFRHGPRRQA